MQALQLAAELLHGGPAAVNVLGPAADDAALLFHLGHGPAVLGLQALAMRPVLVVDFTLAGRELLLQVLQLGPLLLQATLRFVELFLPGRQLPGGLPQRLFVGGLLRVGFGGPLLQFRDPFAEPEPGRAQIAFQLRAAGVELGLAMIEVFLTLAEVPGQLAGLDAQLLGGGLGFLGSGRLGHSVALACRGHRVGGVDAGFGRSPRCRHAGDTLAMASLGGGHVDQPRGGRSLACRLAKSAQPARFSQSA